MGKETFPENEGTFEVPELARPEIPIRTGCIVYWDAA